MEVSALPTGHIVNSEPLKPSAHLWPEPSSPGVWRPWWTRAGSWFVKVLLMIQACLTSMLQLVGDGIAHPLAWLRKNPATVSLGCDVRLPWFQVSVSTLIPAANSVLVLQEYSVPNLRFCHIYGPQNPSCFLAEEPRYTLVGVFKINFIKH